MSKKSLNYYLKKQEPENINDLDATADAIPEQYNVNISPLEKFQPYPNIVASCKEQLLKGKLVIKNPSCYRDEMIQACISFSKTEGHHYNIRKKRHILELDDNKLSNFVLVMVGDIHSCLDNIVYTCYYATTIEKGNDIIITIPKTEPDHAKIIEDNLTEFNKFQLSGGDFSKIYEFCLLFKAYVTKQKEDCFRKFIPREYAISENEEYNAFLIEQERKKAHDKVDEDFEKLSNTESAEQVEPYAEEERFDSDTEIQQEIYMPDIVPYNNCNIFPSMMNLFNLCDSKTMLLLLGFFITNAVPQLSDKTNMYSLAIEAPAEEQAYAKKICDILHRLVLNETQHPSVQFNVNEKIKNYFKKSSYSLPTITINDQFNKDDSKKFSQLLDDYYDKMPGRRKDSLVIIAKKGFYTNRLLELMFKAKETLETERAMKALKADTLFCNTINDFLEHIQHRYSGHEVLHTYDYDYAAENNAELIREEISKKIKELSNHSTLTYEDAIKYSPIVYFLEEYFDFLLRSDALTPEEYALLCKELKAVYSLVDEEESNNNSSKISTEPTTEQISEIILNCISEAYTNCQIPAEAGDYYIYTKCKQRPELICFKHQQSSPMKCIINMIEDFGMGDKISEIKDVALQETTGDLLKQLWEEMGITYAKDGHLYHTRNGKVLAIIPDVICD